MSYEKLTPQSDPDGRRNQNLATPFDDPAVAKRAEQKEMGQPAQVTPAQKKQADRHPEDVPPPGDMGPTEGPGS